jgi:uncharacterized protein (DUF4415 family)
MNRKSSLATFDDDPITQGDIDAGRLVLRKRVKGRVTPAKKRVTLYLEASLIEHFKGMARERGYQTLINEILKKSLQQSDIETMIRKAIREELMSGKAA